MADYHTHVCFRIPVTAAEVALIGEVQQVSADLCDGDVDYAGLSPAFLAAFPHEEGEDPVSGLLALFPDKDYPWIDGDFVTTPDPDKPGQFLLTYGSSEADPDLIARIIQRTCPSALPFRFGWAGTCTRSRPDAFTGGWLEVRADKIVALTGPDDYGTPLQHVVAIRDPEEGLLFWNDEIGWGPLSLAKIFIANDPANEGIRLIHEETVWLELPRLDRPGPSL